MLVHMYGSPVMYSSISEHIRTTCVQGPPSHGPLSGHYIDRFYYREYMCATCNALLKERGPMRHNKGMTQNFRIEGICIILYNNTMYCKC